MKLWIWLSAVLVFASGASVGYVASKASRAQPADAPIYVTFSPESPPYLIASDAIFQEIGLSGDQAEKVEALISDHAKRLKELRGSIGQVTLAMRTEVRNLLNEEQRRRFEEIQTRYGEKETQSRVTRELARLSLELQLAPEQESPLYQVLYDNSRKRNECFQSFHSRKDRDGKDRDSKDREKGRQELREKMDSLGKELESQMASILSAEQFDAYRRMKDRERELWKDRRPRPPREPKPEGKAEPPPEGQTP
jgi:hypothetical protein